MKTPGNPKVEKLEQVTPGDSIKIDESGQSGNISQVKKDLMARRTVTVSSKTAERLMASKTNSLDKSRSIELKPIEEEQKEHETVVKVPKEPTRKHTQ